LHLRGVSAGIRIIEWLLPGARDVDRFDGSDSPASIITIMMGRPAEQIRQLPAVGFNDVRILTLDGKEAKTSDSVDHLEDPWLYYLCGGG
jgi:hypothetical protein